MDFITGYLISQNQIKGQCPRSYIRGTEKIGPINLHIIVASKQTFLNTYVSKPGPKIVFHTPLAPLWHYFSSRIQENKGIAIGNNRTRIEYRQTSW
ncbi:MAG: hypothetical protein WCF23_04380 [Candidatus Nitrosopolaris sp.]